MCGFTAIISRSNNAPELVKRSLDMMSYRGLPDRKTFHSEGKVHIGHTRLPIVDIGPSGDQPAVAGNGMGWLVGEVFNFKEFSDASNDTLAVLQQVQAEGLRSFHKFDGFWSFVGLAKDQLFVVNDYLGQKPVYYRTDMKAIASEPKALLAYGDASWDEVFFSNVRKWGYDPTGRTPWANVKQLPIGHYWYDGQIGEYWDWDLIKPSDLYNDILEATKNRLLGEQPIACLLSGGLDSSIVFKLCQKLGANITSFHVENGEEEFAKLVDPNTRALPLEGISYEEALNYHQSPVDLGSVHPQAVLAKALGKEGYHVALTGDGADELFGGYERSSKYDSQGSDIFVELPYYHLPRLDRLMMRNTIELRTPFLSPKVVKGATQLEYYHRREKEPLKKLFGDLLPKEILDRPKLALRTLKVKNGGIKLINDNIKTFRSNFK